MRFLQEPNGWLIRSFVLASCLQAWFATTIRAAAISAAIDTSNWIGYDGTWSPVSIRIGTQPQWVSVFPSTTTSETLVVGVAGCDGTMQCQKLRGGIFASNISSTFKSLGTFDLGMSPGLGINGAGYYGLDTIALSDDVSEGNQIIGINNSTDIWTGILGLGVQATTFITGESPSFLSSLKSGGSNEIPSLSYGYTAGASYRLKQVPASLTFGGYDENRFKPNNYSFSLDSNQQPVVSLQLISVNGWASDNITLFDSTDKGFFTIDSATPFLWLPESAAIKFEQTFGLQYDDNLQLYFYPNTTQQELISQANMTFDFILTDLSDSSQSLSLSLPGDVFTSLSLTYGFPGLQINATSPPVPYFPIRKAANSTQYIIGRMFLQETYLTVDYVRNNFSLSQAIFNSDAISNTSIVDINVNNSSDSTASQPSSQNQGPSAGAIAGIAVAVVLFVAIVLGTLIIVCVRKRRAQNSNGHGDASSRGLKSLLFRRKPRNNVIEMPAESTKSPVEVPSDDVKELPGDINATAELSSGPGTPYTFSDQKHKFGVDHDPQSPVELPSRTSHEFEGSNLAAGSASGLLPPSPVGLSPGGVSNESLRTSSPAYESSSPLVTPLTPVHRSHRSNGNLRGLYPMPTHTVSLGKGGRSASDTLENSSSFELITPRSASFSREPRASKRFSWEE